MARRSSPKAEDPESYSTPLLHCLRTSGIVIRFFGSFSNILPQEVLGAVGYHPDGGGGGWGDE